MCALDANSGLPSRHSVNVCMYTTLFGIHHGMGRKSRRVLSMGMLLHDFGKTQIELNI
ncbi:hypothetical protein [Paenibacillus popilliae]|uniref:hypothetical protein n=1 Tax=Paenibacillus popilliae TaxID=78057 RepID=UPI00190268AB|nr:hypothetical protein [Paenibacillus popilliae]